MIDPAKGTLLISEPFLEDPNFHRTVILLVEHDSEGSLGFVLNQETPFQLSDFFDETDWDWLIHIGGPVGKDSLFFVHTLSSLNGAREILPGIFWGGDFEQLKFYLQEDLIPKNELRFFLGYSGWGSGQLDQEMRQKSWIVAHAKVEYIFSTEPELWKRVLREMGGEFSWLSSAPKDPGLN
ncbi:MAG: YqgE/AlgH family protein [Bacteroidetes bacterium]|nr:YqgE/AlgH family protein [Bacteroidota bacterium]